MNDVLEHGREGPPPPRWRRTATIALALVAAVAVLGYLALRGPSDGAATPPAAAQSSGQRTEPATPAGTAAATTARPTPSRDWPVVQGACDAQVRLPQVHAAPLAGRTGLGLLVGGSGLRRVDVDTGRAEPVAGVPVDPKSPVVQVVAAGSVVYALAVPCPPSGTGTVYRMPGDGSAGAERVATADALLSDGDSVWAIDYADPPAPVVLRRLDRSAGPVRLPSEADPVAVAGTMIVVSLLPQPAALGAPATVALLDPATGTVTTRLGQGVLLAATSRAVLWTSGRCPGDAACAVCRSRLDDRGTPASAPECRWTLPSGRQPSSWDAAVSQDGNRVAFQLSRTTPDPTYRDDHPANPSDVAVLNLVTGELTTVPGLEIPPKSDAALVFDRDGWLAIGLSHGDQGRVALWRRGAARLQLSPAVLRGALMWSLPVIPAPGVGGPVQ